MTETLNAFYKSCDNPHADQLTITEFTTTLMSKSQLHLQCLATCSGTQMTLSLGSVYAQHGGGNLLRDNSLATLHVHMCRAVQSDMDTRKARVSFNSKQVKLYIDIWQCFYHFSPPLLL